MIDLAMKQSLHLLYHELRDEGTAYSYVMPSEEFAAHCALIQRLQAAPPDTAQLRPEVTFDDGHLSDLERAMPILEQHGLAARFFITAGWTGVRSGYMTAADLRALAAGGHALGAHGMQHRLLTACSGHELEEELGGARRRLEDLLGLPVTTMSLPGGRSDARVMAACRAAGYTQVFTSMPGAEDMAEGPFAVGRLNLVRGTTTAWLERVLSPESGVLAGLGRRARLKAQGQRLLGDRLYARLWAVVNRQEADGTEPGGAAA